MLPFLRHPKTNAANIDASFDPNPNRRHKNILLLMLPFFAILTQAPFVAVCGQQPRATLTSVTPNRIDFSSSTTPVLVAYTTNLPFLAGNVFTVLLSDVTGNFGNPTVIGDSIATGGGTIAATIPAGTPAGSSYRIGIVSTMPNNISANAVGFRITSPITIISVTPDSICTVGLGPTTFTDLFLQCTASGYASDNDFEARIDSSGGDFSTSYILVKITNQSEIPIGLVLSGVAYDPGDYIIRVQASNPVAFSDTVRLHITNGNGLDPQMTLSTRDASSCGGSDGMITANVTGGIAPFAFYLIDKSLITAPVSGSVVNNLAPGNYGMVVEDAVGCSVIAGAKLIRIPRPTIEVSTKGNVSACGSNDGFFTLRVDTLRANGVQTLKPYFFKIAPQGGTWPTSYQQKPVPVRFDNLAEGLYMVTMQDSAGCVSDTLQNIEIKKDTALNLVLSGWGNPTSCGGTDGDITVQATFGSHSTYRYSLSTDGINYGPEQSGRRFGGLVAGTYVIKGRDSRGCFDTLHKTLNPPKGCLFAIAGSANELNVTANNSLALQVFPNPAKTSFTLNLQGSSKESVQVIVTDMFGKKLYQTTGSNKQQYTFGQEFNAGVYMVQVIQGKQIQTIKLVKEN